MPAPVLKLTGVQTAQLTLNREHPSLQYLSNEKSLSCAWNLFSNRNRWRRFPQRIGAPFGQAMVLPHEPGSGATASTNLLAVAPRSSSSQLSSCSSLLTHRGSPTIRYSARPPRKGS